MPRHFALSFFAAIVTWFGVAVAPGIAQPDQPSRLPVLRIEAGMHSAPIKRIGVDAANRFLVSASEDKTVRVWELPAGRLLRVLRPPIDTGNEGKLFAIAISPDGRRIAAGGWTGFEETGFYIFDRESGQLIQRVVGLPAVVLHLAFSPDGRYLAAALAGRNSQRQGVRIYSTKDYSKIGEGAEYDGNTFGLDFDLGNHLVTVAWDGFVRLYEFGSDRSLHLLAKRKTDGGGQPSSVKFSPDGSKIAVGFADSSKVNVFTGRDLTLDFSPDTADIARGDLYAVAWSADGKTLYGGGGLVGIHSDLMIRAWSDGGHGAHRDLPAASNRIMDIVALRDGGVAYGTADPAIGLLDVRRGRYMFKGPVIADYRSGPEAFLISHNADTVQFSYDQSGELPFEFSLAARRLEMTPSGVTNLRPPIEKAPGISITGQPGTLSPELNGSLLRLRDGEPFTCFAIAPNEQQVLLGAGFSIYLFDKHGTKLWNVDAPAYTWAVNISGDGKFAVAAYGDGTIRWYRLTDGREQLAVFPHSDRRRWVAWTPEGYYDASPGAEELIGWHLNNRNDQAADFYPIGQFFERFYHPKLLAQVLTAEGVQPPNASSRNAITINSSLRKPPLVNIISPRPGASFNSEAVSIDVAATDQGGGVDEIRLYQNGKLVSDDTRLLVQGGAGAGASATNKTFNVSLVPGMNTFRATAFNKDRTESNPVEIQFELKAAVAASDLYILAIGLNDYKNPKYSLNYGRADAQAFADAAEARGRGIFRKINKEVILDGQATRQGIEAAFAKIIAQAKPQDAFVFYFAGHGVMSEGSDQTPAEFYLVPFDVMQLYGNDGALATNGVAAKLLKDLCTRVRAQKQLIVLDACQSAGVLETFATRGAAEEKAILQLARSAGVVVLAATGQDQVATEFGKLGHGVFTYALLQAINGDADGGNPPDGKITATEIVAFINDRVPELTKQYRGKTQYPSAWSRGQDFPLGIRP